MRTYSFDVDSAAVRPVRLITITRVDGQVYRLCTWSKPITIGSETWTPGIGLVEYAVTERNDGTPASTQLDAACYAGGMFDPAEVAVGLFDGAIMEVHVCDANNPTAKDFHFYGQIYPTMQALHEKVRFEAQNHLAFPRRNLVQSYTVMCHNMFGDRFCRVPVVRPLVARSTAYALGDAVRVLTGDAPAGYGNRYFEVTTAGTTSDTAPTFNYTIGSTTADGSVVFTARNAFERACTIASVVNYHNLILTASPDARAVDGWYNPGKIQFFSGKNKNKIFKIGFWLAGSLQLTTFLPAGFNAEAGDAALIWPDCDKTATMCNDKYANILNNGGFPYFEGAKAAASSDFG